MEYQSTHNTVYACQYHVVFCPKYRRPVLVNGVDERLKEVAAESLVKLEGAEILEMEVMPDHVHLLLEVPPHIALNSVVKRIKGVSSRVLRDEFPWLKKRIPTLWTNSYFASTVGGAPLEVVQKYIENQRTNPRQKEKMG